MTIPRSSPGTEHTPPLGPEFVLREARELLKFYESHDPPKPYTAGVLVDCIDMIERLSAGVAQAACCRGLAPSSECRCEQERLAQGHPPYHRGAAQSPAREPAYCGDHRKIEVSMATWDGIVHYIKTLHKERAVDDAKMQLAAYFPIEHCMTIWGIEPYKIQHNTTVVSSTNQRSAGCSCGEECMDLGAQGGCRYVVPSKDRGQS